jgi:NAD(P)H-dependent flavin oxidoreductase YrpB (nitropropane dioxygenase family)
MNATRRNTVDNPINQDGYKGRLIGETVSWLVRCADTSASSVARPTRRIGAIGSIAATNTAKSILISGSKAASLCTIWRSAPGSTAAPETRSAPTNCAAICTTRSPSLSKMNARVARSVLTRSRKSVRPNRNCRNQSSQPMREILSRIANDSKLRSPVSHLDMGSERRRLRL